MKKSILHDKTYPLEEILTALNFTPTLTEKFLAFYKKIFRSYKINNSGTMTDREHF